MDSSVSGKDEILFLHVRHHISTGLYLLCFYRTVDSSWNVMAHGDAREGSEGEAGEWSGYPVLFTLPRNMVYPALLPLMRTPRLPAVDWTDAPGRFKWTRPFIRKTKSGFCACAITFETQSTSSICLYRRYFTRPGKLSNTTNFTLD